MSNVFPNSLQKSIGANLIDAGYTTVAQANAQGSAIGSAALTTIAGACGNIFTQVSVAGVGNAAVTSNTVLMTAAIPANAFDIAGRIITINAAGKFAANGNNKLIQVFFGTDVQTVGNAIVTTATTSIATSGVQTTNAGGWFASAQVVKYGATGSNTQLGINTGIQTGSTHLGTSVPAALTANEAAITYITLTGASSTTGAAGDVLAQWLELFWDN